MKRILRTRVAALVLGTAGFVFAGCASAPTGPRPQQGTQAVQPEPSADASDADGGKQESPSPAEPESPMAESPEETETEADAMPTEGTEAAPGAEEADNAGAAEADTGAAVGMPNPFVEEDSLATAQETAGFDIELPEAIEGFTRGEVEAIADELIQVFYTNDAEADDELLLRKAVGNLDVTGDYNHYSYSKTETDGGTHVLFRGTSTRAVHAVSWTGGDYSYAIVSRNGIPLSLARDIAASLF